MEEESRTSNIEIDRGKVCGKKGSDGDCRTGRFC